jgi:hypothetical protein
MTIAPSWANLSAVAKPMPCAAPVMMETLLSKRADMIIYISSERTTHILAA